MTIPLWIIPLILTIINILWRAEESDRFGVGVALHFLFQVIALTSVEHLLVYCIIELLF